MSSISLSFQPDCGLRRTRHLPSHNRLRKPSRYIRPYQWMPKGPRWIATGSSCGCISMRGASGNELELQNYTFYLRLAMPEYRSRTTTHGRNMAGARALWRATGMKDEDFTKPIIAISNSFTQFVPGHVHLKDLGQLVAREIERAGGVAKEFNTIAVDDGIAMGHGGMLYSLPSRDLIADSVEYMVNAHCADALVCISNCDKITPGMLMAAMRLNIPTVFVSGGPMAGGTAVLTDGTTRTRLNLVTAIADAVADTVSDADIDLIEEAACPTCGSCSGMFTANSMNCLVEALGLAL